MNEQGFINYSRIAEVIECILHSSVQPTLEDIARKVNLSSSQLQKLFIDWAGVGPEEFLKYISVQHAKQILSNTELSDTARLHDSFVEIQRMTSEECKNKGESLTINYNFAKSVFGEILVASTHKGICYMGFSDDKQIAFSELEKRFPNAGFIHQMDDIQQIGLQFFTQDWRKIHTIKLHLKGTDFQLKIWEALLKIPLGNLTTYGQIAEIIQNPKAARAVGTAIGSNPIAFLIPCHRVIQSSGVFGGYMWGTTRKTAILGWEAAKVKVLNTNF